MEKLNKLKNFYNKYVGINLKELIFLIIFVCFVTKYKLNIFLIRKSLIVINTRMKWLLLIGKQSLQRAHGVIVQFDCKNRCVF